MEIKETVCEHCIIKPDDGTPLCFYYSKVKRKDKKYWAHFPNCADAHCPIKHPELLLGESPIN